MAFTPAQVDLLDRNLEFVEYRRLFRFVVGDQTFRLAESEYPIEADGFTWLPALSIISASIPPRTKNFISAPAEWVIAGLPESPTEAQVRGFDAVARSALHQPDEWFGKDVEQLGQLLVNRNSVGPPITIFKGWMARVVPLQSATRALFKITAEGMFARRSRTPLGQYTDRDRQRRYPGDLGSEFVASLKSKKIEGFPF